MRDPVLVGGRTAPVILPESNYAILVELLLLNIICAAHDVAGSVWSVSVHVRVHASRPITRPTYI